MAFSTLVANSVDSSMTAKLLAREPSPRVIAPCKKTVSAELLITLDIFDQSIDRETPFPDGPAALLPTRRPFLSNTYWSVTLPCTDDRHPDPETCVIVAWPASEPESSIVTKKLVPFVSTSDRNACADSIVG